MKQWNLTVFQLETVWIFGEGDKFEKVQVCKTNAKTGRVLYLGN